MLLEYGLQEAGSTYKLQVARDGEEAIDVLRQISAARETPPDLILLDLNLPKRSGHEVLAMIKGDPTLRLIPVVILSSSQAPSDIMAAYRQGANSYLQKPSNIEGTLDLMRTVEHYWLDLAFLPSM